MTKNANLPAMTTQQTKDLLIHAAKAAGLEGYTFQESTPPQSAMMVRRNIDEHGWDIGVQEFDPINCDGDTFGLMCHKRMDVCIDHNNDYVDVYLYHETELVNVTEYGQNIKEATRLAITKAVVMTEGWRE
jgi:hypothetical protein